MSSFVRPFTWVLTILSAIYDELSARGWMFLAGPRYLGQLISDIHTLQYSLLKLEHLAASMAHRDGTDDAQEAYRNCSRQILNVVYHTTPMISHDWQVATLLWEMRHQNGQGKEQVDG